MNATERPEIEIKIQKKGIWKFIPWGFDIFSQKFLVSLENNSNQDVELDLECNRMLGPWDGVWAGEIVRKFSLKAKERKVETFSLKVESGVYKLYVTVRHEGQSWEGYEIKGLNEFRVLETRGLIIGTLIGTLVSLMLTFLLLIY